VTIVVFAFGKGFFNPLPAGDVYDRDGDADDLVGFVTGRLIADEIGAIPCASGWVGITDLEIGAGFTIERALQVGLPLAGLARENFSEASAQVGGHRKLVDFGETFVDTDKAEIAIEKTDTDGDAVVDCVELSEALSWESFEAWGSGGVDGVGACFGRRRR
jgi:hypothetical protein